MRSSDKKHANATRRIMPTYKILVPEHKVDQVCTSFHRAFAGCNVSNAGKSSTTAGRSTVPSSRTTSASAATTRKTTSSDRKKCAGQAGHCTYPVAEGNLKYCGYCSRSDTRKVTPPGAEASSKSSSSRSTGARSTGAAAPKQKKCASQDCKHYVAKDAHPNTKYCGYCRRR